MKTVQMTFDEDLIVRIDQYVKVHKTTRSAFARLAIESELEKQKSLELEKKQIEGYKKHPIKKNEFSVWENEQEWGD